MDPYIGQIVLFAGTFAPEGWALCDGQLLPIQGNEALFVVIGTAYGGDGVTNFALPDLRGAVAIGADPGATRDIAGDPTDPPGPEFLAINHIIALHGEFPSRA